MSQLLEEHDELLAASSREVTLSTGAILSIFVGLALLCGLFFGFGYNIGRKSAAAAALAAISTEPASPASPNANAGEAFDKFKPSAATPTKSLAPLPADRQEDVQSAPASTTPSEPHATTTAVTHAGSLAKPAAAPSSASRPAAVAAPSIKDEGSSTAGPAGSSFVQVAAVSHAEDASLLMGALRARGYAVTQRSEPADKLIHIQVGPFGSKLAAEAMRQRLQTDGYNAIIK